MTIPSLAVVRALAAGLCAVTLSACNGGGAGGEGTTPPAGDGGSSLPMIALTLAGPPGLGANSVTLINSVRVGRTVFDYTYTATATNGTGAALQNVMATVTSDAPTTVVTDSTLAFGDLAAGVSAASTDTFTIRQDRAAPLAAANLTITLTGEPVIPGPAEGVLLSGQAGDPALSALTDMMPIPAAGADIGNGVLLTRLDVALASAATIGEVNNALSAVGGGIVGMLTGLPTIVIAVPRQSDADALQALADRLSGAPGINFALIEREDVGKVAPPSPANAEAAMRHLQDSRFPAAWNVNALAGDCTDRPVVMVADFFTRPIPGNSAYADFTLEVPGVDQNGIGGGGTSPDAGFHGYDVTTTLAAALDDRVPTGANPFPGCLDVRTVQLEGLGGVGSIIAITASLPPAGKVVVNASFGYGTCSDPCTPAELQTPRALDRGKGAADVRAILAPLANRVLITAAAGNEADDDMALVYPGTALADFSSKFNAAARADPGLNFTVDDFLWEPTRQGCPGNPCFPSLTATPAELSELDAYVAILGPAGRIPASNVLIVGSTQPGAIQISAFSNGVADVTAVGERIPTLRRNAAQEFVTTRGTSFAAPQAAALASYLWAISPELRSRPLADTISAIKANASQAEGQLNAYASVLSVDPAGTPDPVTWTVRRTLLDVDRDGRFTETDIAAFVSRYFEAPGFEVPLVPATQDYGRFDLNGDGYTGGPDRRDEFDLDRTGSVQFGAPVLDTFDFEIATRRRLMSEASATDLDILCFYAYSPLFQGDEAARERQLVNKCGVIIAVVVAPSGTGVSPGGTQAFAADVSGTTDPRVTWALPGGGGTIDATGLFTAGSLSGTFIVRAISVVDPNAFGDATVTIGGLNADRVVFQRQGDVFLLNLGGGSPINVTNRAGSDIEPRLAPDGSRIAFIRDGFLSFIDPDGGNLAAGNLGCDYPTWAGNSALIACEDPLSNRRIRLVQSGISSFLNLPNGLGLGSVPRPVALSPAGDRVAFAALGLHAVNIQIINVDGTGLVNLTNFTPPDGVEVSCAGLDWSPNGEEIVAVCTEIHFDAGIATSVNRRLQVFPVTGGAPRTLLDNSIPVVSMPDWSPDGSALVLVLSVDNAESPNTDLFTIGADGSGLTRITSGSARDDSPSWGP